MKTNVTTKIKDIKFGAKEDVITLTIDGNISDQQVSILRNIKKTGVAFVSFSSSQADLDDFEAPQVHEGIKGTIDSDGSVSVDSGQMTLEEVADVAEEEDENEEREDNQNEDVEKEDDDQEEQQDPDEENCPPINESDDDLPF
jgi:single-stranded DNA-binding protein